MVRGGQLFVLFSFIFKWHQCRCHPAPLPSSPYTDPAPVPLPTRNCASSARTGAVVTPHRCRRYLLPVLSSTRTSAFNTLLHQCRQHPAPVPSNLQPVPSITRTGAVGTLHWCHWYPALVLSVPCTGAFVIPTGAIDNGSLLPPTGACCKLAPVPLSARTRNIVTLHWCRLYPPPMPSSPHTVVVVILHQYCHQPAPVMSSLRTVADFTPEQCRHHIAVVTPHRCCCHTASGLKV